MRSPQTSPISFSASGDNILVAAQAAGPISIAGMMFTVGGATNVIFKKGATAFSGAMIFTANGSSMTLPLNDEPWYRIPPGSAFVLNSSAAVAIGGIVWWING